MTGTKAAESMVRNGAPPSRVRVFANTIDVGAWAERAARLRERRQELRAAVGASDEDVVVLSGARLAPEKRLETLVRAANDPRLVVVVAGSGSERERLARVAADVRVRVRLRRRAISPQATTTARSPSQLPPSGDNRRPM